MYITCEQCSTIFRLDAKRLKPTGSKVRCSQCGSIFMAWPMASTQTGAKGLIEEGPVVAPSLEERVEDTFDQELDGIDLAELDSILERDRKVDHDLGDSRRERIDTAAAEPVDQLDEADLDLDFESALALDEEPAAEAASEAAADESEELDLEMDFELEPEASPAGADNQLEDELEMDFELDQGMDLETEETSAEKKDDEGINIGEDEIEMALDDFEDALGAPEEIESDIPLQEEVVEEDLALDMDLDLDEEPAQSQVEDQELELSLDDGDLFEAGQETASDAEAGPAAGAKDEEIDLTELGGLLDEDEAQLEEPAEDEDIEFSLDEDLEFGAETEPLLDLEGEDTAAPQAEIAGSAEEGLDLGGFDDLLDEDHETEEAEPEDQELSLDDEAGFDLEEEISFEPEAEKNSAAEVPAAEIEDDGLDLAALDSLLDESDEQTVESEPEELHLSLDDGSEEEPVLEMEKQDKADTDLGGLEDLEFELDAEFEDKPVSKTASADQPAEPEEDNEELDLSDIEKMLEDDSLTPEPASAEGDLELDLTGGAEKWVDEVSRGADEDESKGEFDLTEIEAAIDDADEHLGVDIDDDIDDDRDLELDLEPFEGEQEEQEDELDFELEMEDDASAAAEPSIGDDTDEIDLSDVDLSIEEEKPENEVISAGDIELEFQIEEDQPSVIDSTETLATETSTAAGTTAAFGDTGAIPDLEEDQALIEEAFAAKTQVGKPAELLKPVRKKKKGGSKFLVVILILALLGGGGYFGYGYVIKNNITIPYLSDYINPKPKDPSGTAMLSTLEINSKFIENEKAGRIFVVTGKIRNSYSVPRKMIRLQGKLFTKGKVLAKTETVYAGVAISDAELASQDIIQIKQRLKAAGGAVRPGQNIAFIVVFSDLPADLDEFAIELASSSQGP